MEQIKKVLVLGCKGMAGHVIKTHLESLGTYEIWGLARDATHQNNIINLDISNTKELEHALNNESFDVVINCIGLLNNTAENNPELAIWFNGYLPHLLALLGKKYSFKLIHISTDCVFSGDEGGYEEDSFKNGVGFYAQSKALGEVVNSKDLTLRTSIIGPEINPNGIGLFHWFMNQSEDISGYTDSIWSGVTTIELARVIDLSIRKDLIGLHHITNNKSINKYELIKLFKKYSGKDINISAVGGKKSDKSFVDTRNLLDYKIPSYDQMIYEMIELIRVNDSLYSKYNIK